MVRAENAGRCGDFRGLKPIRLAHFAPGLEAPAAWYLTANSRLGRHVRIADRV